MSRLCYDEMRATAGAIRPQYRAFSDWLDRTPADRIARLAPFLEFRFPRFGIVDYDGEARRVARFWPHGHTPGPLDIAPEAPNPATPTTLDLRWQPGS